MNQTQPYMDMHSSHFSSPQPYASHGATASAMGYPNYQPQPPVLHPGSTAYPSAGASYQGYGYPSGVTSPHATSQPPSTSIATQGQLLPLPVSNHSVPPHGYVNGSTPPNPQQPYTFDTTGQVAPPGAKPRVTATLWEDEGSLCYQVEAKGVCVARREDNHMINGTKLLNVAGMTRGRRDGILKSEKVRHVVKIGPMHLKGVWIPFERALDFANKEKITDLLYPLFVHNIGGLLYHPTNQNRTNMVVQDSQQRRLEGARPARPSQGAQPSTLHHHHSLQTPTATHIPQNPAPSIPPSGGRPTLDRAHTFPTPPTSASGVMSVQGQSSTYDWGNHSMNSGVQGTQPLSIDTGLSNARSMPTTPATTPPGGSVQGISYQNQSAGYDGSKPYYSSAPPSQPQYAQPPPMGQQGMGSYSQSMTTNSYMKTEMAPPSGRPTGGHGESDQSDVKSDRYAQPNGQVAHGSGEGDAVQDHESDYIHDSNTAYHTSRNSYTYSAGDHSQLSSALAPPQSHQNGGDQMTPRTATAPPSQWTSGYSNPPPRTQTASLFNLVSDPHNVTSNGANDSYGAASASTYHAPLNGSISSNKRHRDEDDDHSQHVDSRGATDYDGKRRKTLTDSVVGGPLGPTIMNLQTVPAGPMSRRR